MNQLQSLVSQYGMNHQNRINQVIHLVCVPAILWSLLGILHTLPTPNGCPKPFTWDIALIGVSLLYYFYLNVFTGLVMLFIGFVCFSSYVILESKHPGILLPLSTILFVTAWLGQFLGHKIEGSKPSFFSEIKFLLIGPLWTLNHFMPYKPLKKSSSLHEKKK